MHDRYKYLIWDQKCNDMDTDFRYLNAIMLYYSCHSYKMIE